MEVSEMKITVIGAGQGGLYAAALLAKGGADVTVYEKCAEDTLGIDWFDGVEIKLFTDLGLEVPPDSFKGFPASFIGPLSDKLLYLWCPADKADWSVNRRSFSKQLVGLAKQSGAKFVFETAVDSLIINKTAVKGVRVAGEDTFCDLVIDSSGVFSPFRASLPKRAHITAQPDTDDIFNVYRGIYSQTPDYPELPANEKFKMYLKYLGKKSISWCGVEPSGELNVLTGMIGGMSADEQAELFTSLKADNPIIGEVKDGRSAFASIPVRAPLSMFCTDGYAAIGDAAFMTIPVMGNGIANSIRAGKILAETVLDSGNASLEALWTYQVKYYKQIGAVCFMLDFCKRGLLATNNAEMRAFMESGAVTDDDIKAVMSGSLPRHSPAEWAKKVGHFIASRAFIGGVAKYALKGVKTMLKANAIPTEYDIRKVEKWQTELEDLMKKQ